MYIRGKVGGSKFRIHINFMCDQKKGNISLLLFFYRTARACRLDCGFRTCGL